MKNIVELKVGDKVYKQYKPFLETELSYKVSKVVRLTKTRAVLDNGTHLINENRGDRFCEYGNAFTYWNVMTDQSSKEISEWRYEKSLFNWWRKYVDKANKNQIERIYNLLKDEL